MKRVDDLLSDYGAHHRTRGNLVCHAFGVTLIVFGILSLSAELRVGPVTAGEILIAVVVLDVAARAVGDWRVGLAAFAIGWVFQAVGHAVYEKNRPAFFKNLQHLLVGPLFLVNELLGVHRVAPVPR